VSDKSEVAFSWFYNQAEKKIIFVGMTGNQPSWVLPNNEKKRIVAKNLLRKYNNDKADN